MTRLPLLAVQLVVALLLGLTIASVVQMVLPAGWPFAVRFWVPAGALTLALLVGQVWAFAAVRDPGPRR